MNPSMFRKCLYLLLLPILLIGKVSESEGVRRVRSHLIIDDTASALQEAQDLIKRFPSSKEIGSVLVEALAAAGEEEKALESWHALSTRYPDLALDRHLLEELSWGVLRKGLDSTQYGVRLASLVGAFLTRDTRALPFLVKMMRDSNAVVRSVAAQMATQYQDAPLKDEIVRLMHEEKVWIVRLEVIRSAGALRIKEMAPFLKHLIQSEKTTYEERMLAIESLCYMCDSITIPEWKVFAESNRAGMRHLACSIALHFKLEEVNAEMLRLLHDPHPDVRMAALNAFGLFYRKLNQTAEIQEHIRPLLQDPTPEVAVTAAWAALLSGLSDEGVFERFLTSSLPEQRRFTAAALSATGTFGASIAKTTLKTSQDPYVKANLALGLLGQREEIALCSDILYEFCQDKRMWMWDTRPNPLFRVLAPSQVRHVDHIPNYPESIDQMTRLNLIALLAVVEDPRAIDALKTFLKKKSWGITGVAAATLLQEGDEASLEVVRMLLNDPDPNVRLQACFVLAMLGRDESVLRDLQGAYTSADHEKKLHILEAMGHVGGIESFHFLLSAFNEPFPILRVAAAAALIQSIHR